MTQIKLVRPDNTIEVLFETYFTCYSKHSINTDGSHDIFLYYLIDYDIGIPGFFVFHYDHGNYELIDYSNEELFPDNFYLLVDDVIRVDTDDFMLLNYKKVSRLSGTDMEVMYEFDNEYGSAFSLLGSQGDTIFISKSNVIYMTSGDSLQQLTELDDRILDYKEKDGINYFLLPAKLVALDDSFTTVTQTISLPGSLESFEFIHLGDSTVYSLITAGNSYELYKTDSGSSSELIFAESVPDEVLSGFNFIDHETFLLQGTFQKASASRNSFFRNCPVDEIPQYTRANLDISYFRVHKSGIDSSFSYINSLGDSVFRLTHNYEYDLKLKNNSAFAIDNAGLYTSNLTPFYHLPFFEYFLESEIAAFEEQEISGSFSHYVGTNFHDGLISLPGANYRFNNSIRNAITADFTSSNYALTEQNSVDIHIYPNPCSDMLYIKNYSAFDSYAVYDISSSLMMTGSLTSGQIETALLPPATYQLIVFDDRGNLLGAKIFLKY